MELLEKGSSKIRHAKDQQLVALPKWSILNESFLYVHNSDIWLSFLWVLSVNWDDFREFFKKAGLKIILIKYDSHKNDNWISLLGSQKDKALIKIPI